MRESRKYQLNTKVLLERHFDDVKIEWSISRNATDLFTRSEDTYAPCLDLAVGPFNIHEGDRKGHTYRMLWASCPVKLKRYFTSKRLSMNPNPRCALGIEVVFNGSSKHILGDITNSSMIGLYGIVIATPEIYLKVSRIYSYVVKLKRVGKAPVNLFDNTFIIKTTEFQSLLR